MPVGLTHTAFSLRILFVRVTLFCYIITAACKPCHGCVSNMAMSSIFARFVSYARVISCMPLLTMIQTALCLIRAWQEQQVMLTSVIRAELVILAVMCTA